MTRAEKKTIVQKLGAKLASSHFYITDSQGLNAQQIGQIRRACYEKDIHYQVVKNTLLIKTLNLLISQTDYTPLVEQVLKGPSSIFISQKIASEPAKIIQKFQKTKKSPKPFLKAAVIDGELFIGSAHLATLSKLKPKEVLIGEVLGLLQTPVHRLITTLQSSGKNLARIVKTLSNNRDSNNFS